MYFTSPHISTCPHTTASPAPLHLGGANTAPAPSTRSHKGIVERYVSYSIPTKLYSNLCRHQRGDNTAHKMPCCISSTLCCCGVVLVVTFLLLPVAMIVTSGLSFNVCTRSGGTLSKTLPLYLAIGGGLLGLLFWVRVVASSLTCCRNRAIHGSTTGYQSKVCICLFEIFIALWLVVNIALLGVASYFQFKELPKGMSFCNGQHHYYYYMTVSYMFLQYLLYILSCVFCCLFYWCQRAFG